MLHCSIVLLVGLGFRTAFRLNYSTTTAASLALKGVERSVMVVQRGFCKPRRVICVETGEIFESMTEAANHVGRSYSSIKQAIHHPCKCAGERHLVLVPAPTLKDITKEGRRKIMNE
eukprot:g65543.t1